MTAHAPQDEIRKRCAAAGLELVSQEVWICQGPPRCALEGDAAVAAQEAGCIWCDVITIHPDGTETHRGPTTQ